MPGNLYPYGIIYFYSARAGELLGHVKDSWMLILTFFVKESKISPRVCVYLFLLWSCEGCIWIVTACWSAFVSAERGQKYSLVPWRGVSCVWHWQLAGLSGAHQRFQMHWGLGHSPAGVASLQGSPPCTCWTLPCAARAARAESWPCGWEGSAWLERRWDEILLPVKCLELLHPSQADVISHRGWSEMRVKKSLLAFLHRVTLAISVGV